MTIAKNQAEAVLNKVLDGYSVSNAVGLVALEESVSTSIVEANIKTARYLILNDHDRANPLLTNKPEDVVVIWYGWAPDRENTRERVFSEMGVPSISCLPCLMAWMPEHQIVDEDSSFITIPAGYKEHRLPKKEDFVWTSDQDPADRTAPLKDWAMLTAIPPAIE